MSKSHGMSHTRLHNIWLSMRARCNKPNNSGWVKYGAKGIRVCDEWNTCFETFRDWAFANGYSDELTIDRINPKGNYEPSNCRWATQKVQQNNRSNNIYLTYKGERKKLEDWAKEIGVNRSVLYHRYKHGWDAERIINQPKRKSPTQKSESKKVPESSISIRFNDDMDILDAIHYIGIIDGVDYESIEPYGKASGIVKEIKEINRKLFIYRNATGYVFDFRNTIFEEETGELKSGYTKHIYRN